MSKLQFDSRYPSVDDLRNKARKRIPKFAFEYLDGAVTMMLTSIKTRKKFERLN